MKEFQEDGTTPEQSKRLLELGVPADSANYRYVAFSVILTHQDLIICYTQSTQVLKGKLLNIIPCWSALRLMEIIDICALGESSDPNTEEYPSTIKVMNKLHIPYVEYLVKSIERAVQLGTIDFSKLDIQ